eukprot:scaffold8036_cov99-Skeletonema_marinoi.AAC.3
MYSSLLSLGGPRRSCDMEQEMFGAPVKKAPGMNEVDGRKKARCDCDGSTRAVLDRLLFSITRMQTGCGSDWLTHLSYR